MHVSHQYNNETELAYLNCDTSCRTSHPVGRKSKVSRSCLVSDLYRYGADYDCRLSKVERPFGRKRFNDSYPGLPRVVRSQTLQCIGIDQDIVMVGKLMCSFDSPIADEDILDPKRDH